MKQEIDPKLAIGTLAILIVIVVGVYYFLFRTPSGELTPEQAGVGAPVRPGELPPGTPPPPWASPDNPSAPSNP